LGHNYGDIFIVFKREILHHPDTNISIQAATTFISGNAYKWRQWLGTDPCTTDERKKLYHESKLNASIPGCDNALALELMALTSEHLQLKSMDINYQAVLKRWLEVDSHHNIEAHLPQSIPLDYIDHIYMPQNIYNLLSKNAHDTINAVFKHCITITPHDVELDKAPVKFGPKPASIPRALYQTFVVENLVKRFEQNVTHPSSRPIQGTVITIPSSNFNEHYAMPLTILQAHAQYRTNHSQLSTDNTTYIYWQAMNGDMMLTLSNEQIDHGEEQPNLQCLVCYVARTCAVTDTQYHENASYLNNGQPFQHPTLAAKNTYTAKSNTFYVGCNTDDFITFCLRIEYETGKVTLFHAGSNSIYNHEEISYTFKQSELDLAKLDFIHVSAGVQTVAIRNFIICCEKQNDLHPTIDKDFKKNTSSVKTT
jgi:hypothetical protein